LQRISVFFNSGKLTLALRLLLGALILYAAIPKFGNIEQFSVYMLYSYQFPWLMPNMAHTRIFGLITPYLEVLIGIGLITGIFARLAAYGWGAMTIVYIIVKIHVIFIQGRIIPCGCFPGPLAEMTMNHSIIIDFITLPVLAQIILAKGRRFFTVGSLLPEGWQYKLRYIW
jgi:uncharacterized membrane protein YphA (DoxX/SURF4 family)